MVMTQVQLLVIRKLKKLDIQGRRHNKVISRERLIVEVVKKTN